jgi:hypothetical protein
LEAEAASTASSSAYTDDPLLQLFYGEKLSAEEFHDAMRKQRTIPPEVAATASAAAHA